MKRLYKVPGNTNGVIGVIDPINTFLGIIPYTITGRITDKIVEIKVYSEKYQNKFIREYNKKYILIL